MQNLQSYSRQALLMDLGSRLSGSPCAPGAVEVALAEGPEFLCCRRVELAMEPVRDRPGVHVVVQRGQQPVVEPWSDRVPRPEGAAPLYAAGSDHVIGWIAAHDSEDRASTADRLGMAGAALAMTLRVTGDAGAAETTFVPAQRQPDLVTGLGDRTTLLEQGPGMLTSSAAVGRAAALLLLDLDDFKLVNDTLGHQSGDAVLGEIARRLTGALRETDLAVRLGGDEFVVLASHLQSGDDAALLAQKLLRALEPTVRVADVELGVGASVGVAVFQDDGVTVEQLLAVADRAMYDAKALGAGQWRRRAHTLIDDGTPDAVTSADLAAALHDDQLVLHYQPEVDARTGQVAAFETLVRWQHPRLGLLAPAEFVDLAEQSGLMRDLTRAVLDRALVDHAALTDLAPDACLSVNVPARALLGPGLAEDIAALLEKHGTAPERLIIEINEPASSHSRSTMEVLESLERLGCQASIHEFGAGRTSLAVLAGYAAIREIKLDPALVRNIAEPATERMVRAIVAMAHALDLRVVAEGVDTGELVPALEELGCDRLQGFHIARPASLRETRTPSL